MNIEEFQASVKHEGPPVGLNQMLIALWEDAKGHWNTTHTIV